MGTSQSRFDDSSWTRSSTATACGGWPASVNACSHHNTATPSTAPPSSSTIGNVLAAKRCRSLLGLSNNNNYKNNMVPGTMTETPAKIARTRTAGDNIVPSQAPSSSSSSSSFVSSYWPTASSSLLNGLPFLVLPRTTASVARCDAMVPPPPPPLPPPQSSNNRKGDSTATTSATTTTTTASVADNNMITEKNDDSIAAAAAAVSAYTNPGPYEQAAMDGKRLVMLDTFDGFRCDIAKQINPFMAVTHSVWAGTSMIPPAPDDPSAPPRTSSYTFLAQVAADDRGFCMARVDPVRGSVEGRLHRALFGGLAMGKVQVAVTAPASSSSGNDSHGGGGNNSNDQVLAELDFGGPTWTGNLKYGSMGGDLVYGCNYFQAITPSVSMGGEGMYLAVNQSMLTNYTLKWTLPAKTGDEGGPLQQQEPINAASNREQAASAAASGPLSEATGSSTMCINYNTGQQALSLNYKRVVTPNRVILGAELQCSPITLDSQVLLGAEFRLQRSKLAFCVHGTTGRIQSLVEAKLGSAPGSPTLNLSADVDHWEDKMRFGYGVNIEV